jgi:SAM-dependent methyltransferase
MNKRLKKLVGKLAPSLLAGLNSISSRRYFHRRFHGVQAKARACLFGVERPRVLSGPFAGMLYLDATVWGSIVPKWLGSYEWELAGVVEQIIARRYPVIVDVGCAEGYYAVGLANRIGDARVFAFDMDPVSRLQTRRLSALAGVGNRLETGSFCGHRDIESIRRGGTGPMLLVCDIEGSEFEFLDPARCAVFEACDMLVEIHSVPGIPNAVEEIADRFRSTHGICRLDALGAKEWAARNATAFSVHGVGEAWLASMAEEYRSGGVSWLWMTSVRDGGRF